MREIKFRAWDSVSKRFIYVTLHPTHIGWASSYFIPQCLLRGESNSVEGVGFAGIEGWQQYTGLKDRDRKEIYEGDIVSHPSVYGIKDTSKVCYYSGYFYPLVTVEDGYNSIDNYRPEDYEIIGNIYQNPELLKKD